MISGVTTAGGGGQAFTGARGDPSSVLESRIGTAGGVSDDLAPLTDAPGLGVSMRRTDASAIKSAAWGV
jgi:hypothetical protein